MNSQQSKTPLLPVIPPNVADIAALPLNLICCTLKSGTPASMKSTHSHRLVSMESNSSYRCIRFLVDPIINILGWLLLVQECISILVNFSSEPVRMLKM